MSENQKFNLIDWLEKNIFALFMVTALTVSIAGIVEIVPLFFLKSANDYTVKTDKYGNVENKKFPELVWHRTFTKNAQGQIVSDKAVLILL